MGIRELSESLAIDCFKNTFTTDTGTPKNPLLDEVDDGETGSTLHVINSSSYSSYSTENSNIYYLTINSASSPASTLVDSTMYSHHTSEKEGAKEGGRYNRTDKG